MRKTLLKKDREEVIEKLMAEYPDAKAELDFSNPFELLIATILSAQCTDVRVNKVTAVLFEKHKTPSDILKLTFEELEKYIHSCGCANTKAKNILKTCEILEKKYESEVPTEMEELVELPGVGRKTANVVMSCAFGKPAIAVDTHVFRVSNRIGLVNEDNVLDTEKSLMKILKKDIWSKMHHVIIFHGRRKCKARGPLCDECNINDKCLYFKNLKNN